MRALIKKPISFVLAGLLLLASEPIHMALADDWEGRIYDTALPARLVAVDKSRQHFMFFEKKSPLALKLSYPCSTGQASGDKQVLGDKRTPEGIYFVEYKIANGLDFKEYGGVAYTLNYPNPVDKLRGKSGHGIWIHSKGQNIVPKDTRGCVAIDLKNIEQVGPEMPAGTAVLLAERISDDAFMVRDPGIARKLREKMHLWTQAWANRSVDMFDFYNQDAYTKAMPETFSTFKTNKERLFRMLPWISIYNRDIFVLEGPGYWVTWAEQFYRAPNLSTEGIRRLYWQQEKDGQFKIVGMDWIPRDVGMHADYLKGVLVAAAPSASSSDRPRSAAMSEVPAPPPISMPEDAPPHLPEPAPLPQNLSAEVSQQKIMPPAVLPQTPAPAPAKVPASPVPAPAQSAPVAAQEKVAPAKTDVRHQPKAEAAPVPVRAKSEATGKEDGFLDKVQALFASAGAVFETKTTQEQPQAPSSARQTKPEAATRQVSGSPQASSGIKTPSAVSAPSSAVASTASGKMPVSSATSAPIVVSSSLAVASASSGSSDIVMSPQASGFASVSSPSPLSVVSGPFTAPDVKEETPGAKAESVSAKADNTSAKAENTAKKAESTVVKEEAKRLSLSETDKAALKKLAADWSAAWEKRSPTFFDFYDQLSYGKFKKSDSFKSLRADMERRFHSAPWVHIVSRPVTVEEDSASGYAVTVCEQYIRTPNQPAMQGVRKLYWNKDRYGGFKIVAMEWTPEELGMQADYLEKIAPGIVEFIESWRKAWEQGDLKAYEGFYARNARQGNRQGQASIVEHKRIIWVKANPKDVDLGGTRILLDPKGVRVDMTQVYRDSLGFQDKGLKSVILEPDGYIWKILVEDWSALPS